MQRCPSGVEDFSIILEPFDLLLSTIPYDFIDRFVPESTDFRSPFDDRDGPMLDNVGTMPEGYFNMGFVEGKSPTFGKSAWNRGGQELWDDRVVSINIDTVDNISTESESLDAESEIKSENTSFENGQICFTSKAMYNSDEMSRLQPPRNSIRPRKSGLRYVTSSDELLPSTNKLNAASSPKYSRKLSPTVVNNQNMSTTAADVTDDVRDCSSQSDASTSAEGKKKIKRRPFRKFILRRVVRSNRQKVSKQNFARLDSNTTESATGSKPVSRNTSATKDIKSSVKTNTVSLESGIVDNSSEENIALESNVQNPALGRERLAKFFVLDQNSYDDDDDDDDNDDEKGDVIGDDPDFISENIRRRRETSESCSVTLTRNSVSFHIENEIESSTDTGFYAGLNLEDSTQNPGSLTNDLTVHSSGRIRRTLTSLSLYKSDSRRESTGLPRSASTYSMGDQEKGSRRESWAKRAESIKSGSSRLVGAARRSEPHKSPEELANPTIACLASVASAAVLTCVAPASSAAATTASSLAEQHQVTIRVEDLLPPKLDERDVDLSIMFLPQMVVSCMAIWCCGCVMGLIGFAFSVMGSRRIVRGQKAEAKKYEILSYVFSLIGFVGGLILMIIFLVYTVLAYNTKIAAAESAAIL